MAPSRSQKSADDLQFLSHAVASITALIQTFQKVLLIPTTAAAAAAVGASSSLSTADPPNPIALLSDASRILEAQTTKLSLLILNEPFTPKEIAHILNAIRDGCLPALASTLELCPSEKYTAYLHRYVHTSLSRIWAELLELIGSIPQSKSAVKKLHCEGGKGALASTGVLWAECRKLTRLGSHGAQIVFQDEVKSNMALIEDAIGELEEWDPDEDEEDDSSSSEEDDEDDKTAAAERKALKKVINTPTTSEDEDASLSYLATTKLHLQQPPPNPLLTLKPRVLKHLKLLRMLCEALNKRRIASFPPLSPPLTTTTTASTTAPNTNNSNTANTAPSPPLQPLPSPTQTSTLDLILTHTQFFTSEADEIAGALYAGDASDVEQRLGKLRDAAKACVGVCRTDWRGEEDGFTVWSAKWVARVEEIGI